MLETGQRVCDRSAEIDVQRHDLAGSGRRRRLLVSALVVDSVEDVVCDVGDTGCGFFDFRDVTAGPTGDVGGGVVAGVHAECGRDDVGDAFGFDLGGPSACGVVVTLAVHEDVREFMRECFAGLRGRNVGSDPDDLCGRVGPAVRATTVTALNAEPFGGTSSASLSHMPSGASPGSRLGRTAGTSSPSVCCWANT